jgi:hypothetical protein
VLHRILRGFSVAVVVSTLAPAASASLNANAQTPTTDSTPRIRAAIGVSVDRFIYEGDGLTAVSFRYSALRPRKVGTEFSVSVFPDAISGGALLLAPDLGPAFNATGPDMNLLFKAGFSSLAGLGGSFLFYPGIHFGSGLVMRAGEATGVRVDVIRHIYLVDQETDGLWSLGLGITSLPRKLKPVE